MKPKPIKNEPALVIGAIVAVLVALQEALASGLDWKAALPVVVAAIVRQFVTPAA